MSQQTAEKLREAALLKQEQAKQTQAAINQQTQILAQQERQLAALDKQIKQLGQDIATATTESQKAAISDSIRRVTPQFVQLKNVQIPSSKAKLVQLRENLSEQQRLATEFNQQALVAESAPDNSQNNTPAEPVATESSGPSQVNSSPQTTEGYRGPSRDDEGNLRLGWDTDERGLDYYVGPDYVSQVTFSNTLRGISGVKNQTRAQATLQDATIYQQTKDWRVKLSLAPSATYLYKDPNLPGILKPLQATDGIIFPYTPAISVQYSANYDAPELIHSNYKIWQYKGSAVDTVNITCDFTAQDTSEATYLLAVIHFLRSITKMFYGQDQNPKPGTPPPLCYLTGLGEFQFNHHPLVVTQFNYTLPTDVDYIRAGPPSTSPAETLAGYHTPNNSENLSGGRLSSNRLQPGARPPLPNFNAVSNTAFVDNATYVPTKMQISISCNPIVSRNDISNKFSVKEYGSGQLLRGSVRFPRGGIW